MICEGLNYNRHFVVASMSHSLIHSLPLSHTHTHTHPPSLPPSIPLSLCLSHKHTIPLTSGVLLALLHHRGVHTDVQHVALVGVLVHADLAARAQHEYRPPAQHPVHIDRERERERDRQRQTEAQTIAQRSTDMTYRQHTDNRVSCITRGERARKGVREECSMHATVEQGSAGPTSCCLSSCQTAECPHGHTRSETPAERHKECGTLHEVCIDTMHASESDQESSQSCVNDHSFAVCPVTLNPFIRLLLMTKPGFSWMGLGAESCGQDIQDTMTRDRMTGGRENRNKIN
jgi:hypothetical protein